MSEHISYLKNQSENFISFIFKLYHDIQIYEKYDMHDIQIIREIFTLRNNATKNFLFYF